MTTTKFSTPCIHTRKWKHKWHCRQQP